MNSIKEIDETCELSVSEREILRIVLHGRSIARSEIARKTPLAQQTVHRIVDNLERRGYLRFGDVRISGRGKPSPLVSVDPDHYAAVGISVSTENIRFCMLDLAGQPIIEETCNIEAAAPGQAMDILRRRIANWGERAPAGHRILGAGIAMQGFRTGPADRFQPPDLLEKWKELALEDLLRETTGLPSFAENNATASALAQFYLGGDDSDSLAYLSFNHGFGVGIYAIDGLYRGGHGNAGEIGAIFTEEQLPLRPALCGLIDALCDHGVDVRSVSDLSSRFDPQWPGVADWLEKVRPQLHLSLRALQALVDPRTIFFGGEAPEALRQGLLELSEGAFRDCRLPRPALAVSTLEGDPAHLGAGLLPLHKLVF